MKEVFLNIFVKCVKNNLGYVSAKRLIYEFVVKMLGTSEL